MTESLAWEAMCTFLSACPAYPQGPPPCGAVRMELYIMELSALVHAQAREYLNKLPTSVNADDRILVSDVMLATGVGLPLCWQCIFW